MPDPPPSSADRTLGQRVVTVLRGPLARRVRFRFNGQAGPVAVDHSSFDRVARAINSDNIRVTDLAHAPGGVHSHSLAGAYDGEGSRNFFYVRPAGHNSRIWEGTIIHEAVHASIDLTHSYIATADNEAAAFLAGAMYFVMTGLPIPRWGRDASWEDLVRQTATQALRTGRASDDDMANLREQLVIGGYNHFECGRDLDHLRHDRGNG